MSRDNIDFSTHLRGEKQLVPQQRSAGPVEITGSPVIHRSFLSPNSVKKNPNLWLFVTLAAMAHLVIVILLVKSWAASNMPFLLLTFFALLSGLSAYLDYCFIQRLLDHRRQYHTQFKNRFANRAILFGLWIHAALTGMGLFVVGLPLIGYLILSLFYL